MKTPSPNRLGLPTRFTGFDTPLPQTKVEHWSWDAVRKVAARRANRTKTLLALVEATL